MDTEALVELYLMSAGWNKIPSADGTGDFVWDHDQVEVFKTTEEAQELTQQWEDAAFDDDGPEQDCED